MSAKLALVVDDHPDLRELAAAALADDGFRVVLSRNGLEAYLLLARTERPDVIVLDLMMPVMDGWRLLEKFAGFPNLEGIPVVAISAAHGALDRELPVRAFLPKPFDPEELVRTCRQVIAG